MCHEQDDMPSLSPVAASDISHGRDVSTAKRSSFSRTLSLTRLAGKEPSSRSRMSRSPRRQRARNSEGSKRGSATRSNSAHGRLLQVDDRKPKSSSRSRRNRLPHTENSGCKGASTRNGSGSDSKSQRERTSSTPHSRSKSESRRSSHYSRTSTTSATSSRRGSDTTTETMDSSGSSQSSRKSIRELDRERKHELQNEKVTAKETSLSTQSGRSGSWRDLNKNTLVPRSGSRGDLLSKIANSETKPKRSTSSQNLLLEKTRSDRSARKSRSNQKAQSERRLMKKQKYPKEDEQVNMHKSWHARSGEELESWDVNPKPRPTSTRHLLQKTTSDRKPMSEGSGPNSSQDEMVEPKRMRRTGSSRSLLPKKSRSGRNLTLEGSAPDLAQDGMTRSNSGHDLLQKTSTNMRRASSCRALRLTKAGSEGDLMSTSTHDLLREKGLKPPRSSSNPNLLLKKVGSEQDLMSRSSHGLLLERGHSRRKLLKKALSNHDLLKEALSLPNHNPVFQVEKAAVAFDKAVHQSSHFGDTTEGPICSSSRRDLFKRRKPDDKMEAPKSADALEPKKDDRLRRKSSKRDLLLKKQQSERGMRYVDKMEDLKSADALERKKDGRMHRRSSRRNLLLKKHQSERGMRCVDSLLRREEDQTALVGSAGASDSSFRGNPLMTTEADERPVTGDTGDVREKTDGISTTKPGFSFDEQIQLRRSLLTKAKSDRDMTKAKSSEKGLGKVDCVFREKGAGVNGRWHASSVNTQPSTSKSSVPLKGATEELRTTAPPIMSRSSSCRAVLQEKSSGPRDVAQSELKPRRYASSRDINRKAESRGREKEGSTRVFPSNKDMRKKSRSDRRIQDNVKQNQALATLRPFQRSNEADEETRKASTGRTKTDFLAVPKREVSRSSSVRSCLRVLELVEPDLAKTKSQKEMYGLAVHLNGAIGLLQAVGIDSVKDREVTKAALVLEKAGCGPPIVFPADMPGASELNNYEINALIRKLQYAEVKAPRLMGALDDYVQKREHLNSFIKT